MNKFYALLALTVVGASAQAQEVAAAASSGEKGWYALAAGICMGIAVLGGALGQAKAASAALEGIARNPSAQDKVFTPMMIALAFIESLVLFAFAVAFLLKP